MPVLEPEVGHPGIKFLREMQTSLDIRVDVLDLITRAHRAERSHLVVQVGRDHKFLAVNRNVNPDFAQTRLQVERKARSPIGLTDRVVGRCHQNRRRRRRRRNAIILQRCVEA